MYLSFPNLGHKYQNHTDKGLSDSHLFGEKFISDNPTTRPRVDHSRTPNQLPCRSPERPKNTRDFLARPLFPLSLQDGREANHDEEPARVGKLCAVPEAPESQNVHDGRHDVSAHDRAIPTGDLPPRPRAKHNKEM